MSSSMKFKQLNDQNVPNLHIVQIAPFMKLNQFPAENQVLKSSSNSTPLKSPAITSQQLSPLVTAHSLTQRSRLTQTRKNFSTKITVAFKGMPKLFDEKLNDEPTAIQTLKNTALLQGKGIQFQFKNLLSSQSLIQAKDFSPRQEVIELSQWMDNQLQKLEKLQKNQSNHDLDMFSLCQKIMTSAMSELHRQISVDCKERGDLFQLAWNWFIDMTDQMIEQLCKKAIQIEKSCLKKLLSSHETYQKEINVLKDELYKSKAEQHKMNEEVKKISKELEKLENSNQMLRSQALKYKFQYEKSIKIFQMENKENIFMLNKICRIEMDKIISLKQELFKSKDIYSYSQSRHQFLNKQHQETFKNQIFDESNQDIYGAQFQLFMKRIISNIKQQALFEVEQGEDDDLSFMSPIEKITSCTDL